jgi:hypothetical protein
VHVRANIQMSCLRAHDREHEALFHGGQPVLRPKQVLSAVATAAAQQGVQASQYPQTLIFLSSRITNIVLWAQAAQTAQAVPVLSKPVQKLADEDQATAGDYVDISQPNK